MKLIGFLGQRFLFIAMVVFVAFAALAGEASADRSAAANSDAAKACQHGGYVNWTDANGNAFRNQGACVNYVARGGTLAPVAPPPTPVPPAPSIVASSLPNLTEGQCGSVAFLHHFPAGQYYLESIGSKWDRASYVTVFALHSPDQQYFSHSWPVDGNAYTVTFNLYTAEDRTELLATDTVLIQC